VTEQLHDNIDLNALKWLRAWESGRVVYRQQEGGKNPEQERDSAGPDAVHIAAAAAEECEFLLTWNFRYRDVRIRREVERILSSHG
jgi:hypothetical protein